jgi:fructokinase
MAEEPPFVVVGLGEVLWDMLPEGKQLGGAPANFAFHANALGAQGTVVSCVGKDPLGREVREQLQVNGLGVEAISEDPAHPTGTVSVTLDTDGQPSYTIHEKVAWDFIPFQLQHKALATRADAVCFGTLASRHPHSRVGIRQFLDATMPGCLRVFDVNLRQQYFSRNLVQELLERTDVLKLNENELPMITALLNIDGSTKERMEKLLSEYALRTIALTRGARGSVLLNQDSMEVHHGVCIDITVDTVGAGDAFTAVLVMGLLQGWPLEEISNRANQLASIVCGQSGAMASHPENRQFQTS